MAAGFDLKISAFVLEDEDAPDDPAVLAGVVFTRHGEIGPEMTVGVSDWIPPEMVDRLCVAAVLLVFRFLRGGPGGDRWWRRTDGRWQLSLRAEDIPPDA